MSDMLSFCTAILQAIADFLATPPLFYLFGLIILALIVKVVLTIIRPS